MFFPAKMIAAREAKGCSQADLARAIWGTIRLSNGGLGARNRDRISVWERGFNKPNGDNLKRLADALGVAPADLCDAAGPEHARTAPAFRISQITDAPDKAFVQINMPVPWSIVAVICEKLGEIHL